MTTQLWLIRHGEPAEEFRGRCYGSLDVGLSEIGRAQMAKIARYLESERAAAIYASPRLRTVDSARILASGLQRPIEIVPDLREINFGDFEGLSYDDIAARYPDLYRQWMESPTEVHFPNGECEAEVRERVLRAFETICRAREGQTAVIVSHSGVIRIIIAWALRMPHESIFRLSQGHAAVNLLSLHDGFPCVDLLNYRLP
jgi:alpha-ribazole phosphatase